ncbi:MAG: hypothetical protein A4E55_02386 [Pelotomaculum sp. PtaU1.Bin035]|nr:MAG: hypothetical protein A4E55_02386 [Pelotomaculum sp. PtaU1.Bin035]
MKTVKVLADIQMLRSSQALTEPLLDHLEEYFGELHSALGDGEPLQEFSLEEHGYFVILEPGDDARDLSEVGLNPQDGGLLGTGPEWVEVKNLHGGLRYYQAAVLYDNEFMMIFYSAVGQFDQETEEFLAENAGIDLNSGYPNMFTPARQTVQTP